MPAADHNDAAQSREEAVAFIEAFARITIDVVRERLAAPYTDAAQADHLLHPDWDDPALLAESGIAPGAVDAETRAGRRYLHIEVAAAEAGDRAVKLFLGLTGLSDKLQRSLFPVLHARPPRAREMLREEVPRMNAWLDWVRRDGFDPAAFIGYQASLGTHGATQNLTGAIGATGAAIAFIDAIREIRPDAIVDHVGMLPPPEVRSPGDVHAWRRANGNATVKALLLVNNRALVFASSKDANIFQRLGRDQFATAGEALAAFNRVRNDREARAQILHEFAVGEVKTATDLNNLHERLGLASRETQTELRTDRFLMMSVLNADILAGGIQARTMNNRDLTRFSHVFNMHHCWGWDGGRRRHPEHWAYFKASVRRWCGL